MSIGLFPTALHRKEVLHWLSRRCRNAIGSRLRGRTHLAWLSRLLASCLLLARSFLMRLALAAECLCDWIIEVVFKENACGKWNVFSLQLSVNVSPVPSPEMTKTDGFPQGFGSSAFMVFSSKLHDEMPNSFEIYPFIKISCGVPKRSGVVPFTQRI